MAAMSLRSSLSSSSFTPRNRFTNQTTPTQVSLATRLPRIQSVLSNQKPVVSRKLDNWIFDSASEIVTHLRKAPLLVQLHNDGSMEIDHADKSEWEAKAISWKEGGEPAPEGLLLVEEIDVGEEAGRSTKVWGILLQEKGSDKGPKGYLMKTVRVVTEGIGMACTHFVITPVTDYRESALTQLMKCWLVR